MTQQLATNVIDAEKAFDHFGGGKTALLRKWQDTIKQVQATTSNLVAVMMPSRTRW